MKTPTTSSVKYYDLDPGGKKLQNLKFLINSFGIPSTVVEIGCYAGGTMFPFVHGIAPLNPKLQYYAIDPYDTSLDVGEDLNAIYSWVKNSIENFEYKNNIILMRSKSFDALVELRGQQVHPQLIYIDGDHTASTVLCDLVLSFDILAPGGVIICDDSVDWKFKSKDGSEDPQMSPRLAVETFIACNWSKLTPIVLPYGVQTAFKKL